MESNNNCGQYQGFSGQRYGEGMSGQAQQINFMLGGGNNQGSDDSGSQGGFGMGAPQIQSFQHVGNPRILNQNNGGGSIGGPNNG